MLVLFILIESTFADPEHALGIVASKADQANAANTHAESMLSETRFRMEQHLASAKQKSDEVKLKKAQKVQRSAHSYGSRGAGTTSTDSSSNDITEHKLHATLKSHGVADSLVQEINDMATAYIPRETIVQHVKTHYPDKREHEWNDIVIAAVGSQNRKQPDGTDLEKANKENAQFQNEKFQRAKRSFEWTKTH